MKPMPDSAWLTKKIVQGLRAKPNTTDQKIIIINKNKEKEKKKEIQ